MDGRAGLVEEVRRRSSAGSEGPSLDAAGPSGGGAPDAGAAQTMLADWKAAEATYDETREPPLFPLEQLAALYQARQLKKAHEADKP